MSTTVKSNIVSYAKKEIDHVYIYYSINDGEYLRYDMSRYQETTNFTYKFTNLSSGDEVKYYIEASDVSNNRNVEPSCGINDPHHFVVA